MRISITSFTLTHCRSLLSLIVHHYSLSLSLVVDGVDQGRVLVVDFLEFLKVSIIYSECPTDGEKRLYVFAGPPPKGLQKAIEIVGCFHILSQCTSHILRAHHFFVEEIE